MAKKPSPAQAVKQIFSSGKLLFICIIFSITAILSIQEVIDGSLGLTDFEILGLSLDDLFGDSVIEFIQFVAGLLFIFGIIGLIPQILTAVGVWLLKAGAGEGEEKTKTALLGLNLFKIRFLYEAIKAFLMLCIVTLLGVVAFLVLGESGAEILISLLVLALVFGYFFLVFRYYINFFHMVNGVSNTLRSNVNMVTKSGMVIAFNYIAAGFMIFSALISAFSINSFLGFWSFVFSVCDAICLIFVNRLFAHYASLCGFTQKNAVKAEMAKIANDRSLEKTALALGVVRQYAPYEKPTVSKTLFGRSIAHVPTQTPIAPKPVQPVQSVSATQPKTPTPTRAPDITDEIAVRYLALFSREETVDRARYSLCGRREYTNQNGAVTPSLTQVVFDSVSEKKLLRVSFVNNAAVAVKEIKFTVIPQTNELSTLGVMKEIPLSCDADTGAEFGVEYGLILPDNATCGKIKVTYVEFADGTFRDREGGEFFFSTDEKTRFDTLLYLSVMKKG